MGEVIRSKQFVEINVKIQIFNKNYSVQVCLDICSRSWSSSKSPPYRNFSQPNQGKSYGSLYVCALGNFLLPFLFTSHICFLHRNRGLISMRRGHAIRFGQFDYSVQRELGCFSTAGIKTYAYIVATSFSKFYQLPFLLLPKKKRTNFPTC